MKSLLERARAAALKQAEGRSSGGAVYNRSWDAGGVDVLPIALSSKEKPRINIRIVPYTMDDPRNNPDQNEKGAGWWKRRYWIHRVGEERVKVCCLSRTFGKPCPVCAKRRELKREGADDATLKLYNSSERELFNVYNMDDQKLYLMDVSTFCFGQKLLKEFNDPINEDTVLCLDVGKDGKYLACRFDQGTLKDVCVLGDVKFASAKAALPKEILEQALDLDSLLIELSAEELTDMMQVMVPFKEDAKPAEDTAAPAPKQPPAKPAPTPTPEEASEFGSVEDLDF